MHGADRILEQKQTKLTKILVWIEPGHFVSGRFLFSCLPAFLMSFAQ